MSNWMEQLRPGSWRGFPFQVLDLEGPIGRDVVEHSFPLRTGSKGEDMGGVTPRHDIEIFLIGSDFLDQRDAFQRLCSTPGTGPLVLPWLGQVTARLMSGRVRYSDAEGGMVRYRLSFMEESDAPVLAVDTDTGALAYAAADGLTTVSQAVFTEQFNTDGQPQFVIDDAIAFVNGLSDQFDALTAPLKAGADALGGYVQKGLALRQAVVDLVTRPSSLAAQVSGLIGDIRQLASTPGDALRALSVLFRFDAGLSPVSVTTPTRQAQADNRAALTALVAQGAAAEAIKALADSDFVAYQEAVSTRDAYADALDELAMTAADAGFNAVWRAIEAGRVAMIRDVTARGASLARLYSFENTTDVPAIVLARRLYRDTSVIEAMAEDIVARNGIAHPGFVPAGTVLEVLSDRSATDV